MNEHDIAEQAYKNGYEKGYEDGKRDAVKHGRWKYYHKQNIAVCTNCSFERNLDADFGKAVSCPNCGAKMDLEEK